MEPEQRRTGQFVTTFMSAYGIFCGGAIRCITAAPTVSPKTRCSANWESCRFVEPSWSPVRESAVKPVGKPDALIGHVRFDERGWETGRRSGVSARAHPRLYRLTQPAWTGWGPPDTSPVIHLPFPTLAEDRVRE